MKQPVAVPAPFGWTPAPQWAKDAKDADLADAAAETSTMPDVLRKFLTGLSDDDAEQVWAYLDGSNGLEEIDVLCGSHPSWSPRTADSKNFQNSCS